MSKGVRIGLIAALTLATLGLYAYFQPGDIFTLARLKAEAGELGARRDAAPWAFAAGFFAVYVILASLPLPGAGIMTMAAGALLGVWRGFLLVSFASTLGATFAFLAGRYLLRDTIQQRYGARLKPINDNIAREGALYLFALRLVPLFPFFAINTLMGLTPMRTGIYYVVSQIGMIPGTLAYVNAGTQLARIESPRDVLSLSVLGSFLVLAALPFAGRAVVAALRRRRVYARFKRPDRYDNNLVVIGAGAAGLVSSYIAAAVKAKVTLVEAEKMGGDCLNYGCVPSKALIKSARAAHQTRHADHYGLTPAEPVINFRTVMQRIHAIIRTIEPHDSIERYQGLGVDVLQGYARIVDPWTVDVALNGGGTKRLTTRSIVIAAGARPIVPALPGLDEVGYVTSDTLWDEFAKLDAIPVRLVVLGGGPIGCELTQAFARLGAKVTQVQKGPRLLPREDDEVSREVEAALGRDGVDVKTSHQAVRCEREGKGKFIVLVPASGGEIRIEFDQLILAVGRSARLTGYGLEDLGIETSRTVMTNEYLETLYPNIFAAGDVAGPYQFTHTAAHQAWYASVNALFGHLRRFKVDYRTIPWTTFVDPEVARVGLSENEAREQGVPFEVTRYNLDELDRAIADSATRGFVKVLTPPGKDKILGVTIVGEHGGDLLAEFVLAMRHGLGLGKILSTIHTYPTLSEANKYAAGAWRRAHAPQATLSWLKKYHTWRRG
ncbi:MAG: FAD-dependent oxidoreductase [Vicinamibacteria bacterium]|nr:FAD-dependent oxidoreductase [Vicinamibacteria bacterium]